jgi:glycerophosphoryl diester phosphodiesterase
MTASLDELVIEAHRGSSCDGPENTMAAFRRAVDLGVASIELDVHETRDGELVVMHDTTVDRTTAGHGAIAEMTLAALRELDCGRWKGDAFAGERVPTLEEVLALVTPRNVRLNVEVKAFTVGSVAPRRLAGLLRRYAPASGGHVVSSFAVAALRGVREADPGIALAILGNAPEALATALEQRFGWMHVAFRTLTADLAATARAHGIQIMVWTLNEPELLAHYSALGVRKVCTDCPEKMLRAVEVLRHGRQ